MEYLLVGYYRETKFKYRLTLGLYGGYDTPKRLKVTYFATESMRNPKP